MKKQRYTLTVVMGQGWKDELEKALQELGCQIVAGRWESGSTEWAWKVKSPLQKKKLQHALWDGPWGMGACSIAVC